MNYRIPDEEAVIRAGGMRYKSKPPGSVFGGSTGSPKASMSCYKCGIHHDRKAGEHYRVLGKLQFFCSTSCLDAMFPKRKKAEVAEAQGVAQ